MTTRWPIDFDALSKGHVIPAEKLEEVFGVSRMHVSFGLQAMQMCNRVADAFEERGEVVTVVVRRGAIHILTDEDAATHNPSEFRRGLKKAARAHKRNLHVDARLLDGEQRAKHERNLEVEGKLLQAVRSARQELKGRTVKRKTPGLIG